MCTAFQLIGRACRSVSARRFKPTAPTTTACNGAQPTLHLFVLSMALYYLTADENWNYAKPQAIASRSLRLACRRYLDPAEARQRLRPLIVGF